MKEITIFEKNIYLMKIDRKIASKSLTDIFCSLYGENFRTLFEENGEKLIDLGILNAKKYFKTYAEKNAQKSHLSTMIKFFKPSEEYTTVEEMKSTIINQLKPFLTKSVIENLFTKMEYSSFNQQNFAPPKGFGVFQSNIIDGIGESKPKPVKKLSFDYFRRFPIYRKTKSVNLATEGGLGLDQFNYKEVRYYLEENEEFYISEAIAYKYHAIGSLLGREELRIEMVDKLKKYITPDSDYSVKGVLKCMLDAYCFDSEEDSTLLDVQTVCGEDGFLTSKQLDKRLKNFDFSKVKEIFSEKNIKKFDDFDK